jgi:subfamily B ATP-binding cassette protein MsbA
VNSGLIAIGGVNVKEMCLETLQSLIAVVSHDSHLFDATIKENIAIGNPNATMREIVKCAMNANIHDFIKTLPKGYDTSIGELGDKLSGGERQRIIISRALLKDTPILVLDEPTSFLDAPSENVVQETLNNIAKDRTVIIVTHRLSPIANIDNIYLLNKGQCQKTQSDRKNCPNLTPIQRSS